MNIKLIVGLTFVALIAFFAWLPTPEVKTAQLTIIANAEVFDGQQWLIDTDVVFDKGMIIAVGKQLSQKYTSATVVDGRDKFLIPGLIDAHTHAWGDALTQAVQFGVTTEMDMFTKHAFASIEREKRQQHDQDIQQADLFSAGTLVTSPHGHGTEYGIDIETITSAKQADSFVAARIKEGSDYIKIVYDKAPKGQSSIDYPTLEAVIKAAHQQGKLAVVHIADDDSARDAVHAGADGLVHACFGVDSGIENLGLAMAKQQQFIIPTLSVLESMLAANNPARFSQAVNNVNMLAKASVLILAGTDAPNPGTRHGASLHNELKLLVKAGLTSTQALKAATSNVAQAFKLPRRGYIKLAMKADLVLLNQDTRLDIGHTSDLAIIYKNGFVITTSSANKLKKQLSQATLLGDFNHGINSSLGTTWLATTDQRFKGNSTVDFKVVDKHISISGTVGNQFSYPWAGIYLSLDHRKNASVDISLLSTINLRVKGNKGRFKLMLFTLQQPMRPIEIAFKVTDQWTDITLPLQNIDHRLLLEVTGVAIVAAKPLQQFQLAVDDVWIK